MAAGEEPGSAGGRERGEEEDDEEEEEELEGEDIERMSLEEKRATLATMLAREDDGRSDVFGDARRDVLRDGRRKEEVMGDFMWGKKEAEMTEEEKKHLVTIPWWAGKRVLSSDEFEPDLKQDPESWFEKRKTRAPFASVEDYFDPQIPEDEWAESVPATSSRRPFMRRGEELDKDGSPRLPYVSLRAGQVFHDVPIASVGWNIGVGIDIGADYDAGVAFESTAWENEKIAEELTVGRRVDVRITHVRDPHRYVWAVECELLNVGWLAAALPYYGYPLLHIRPEDQVDVDTYADVMQAAGRTAPIVPMVHSDRVQRRIDFEPPSAAPREPVGGSDADRAAPVAFAEDFREVELKVHDPTVARENKTGIEFHRARNSYFLHRHLWESGEELASDNPDFMFRNNEDMLPERAGAPSRPAKEEQYPLADSFTYWTERPARGAGGRRRYRPSSEIAQKYRRPGIGNLPVPLPRAVPDALDAARTVSEARALAGDLPFPFETRKENVAVMKDAVVMRRRTRRHVRRNPERWRHLIERAPADGEEEEEEVAVGSRASIAEIERKLEPMFEATVDEETGEIRLTGVVDVSSELAEGNVRRKDAEVEDVVRFTEKDIETFVDLDEMDDL